MGWILNADRPIYAQIVEKLSLDIAAGNYKPGDKLPSVREFAIDAAVNPNTMQKALSELEQLGLVYSKRTSGRYITEDSQLLADYRQQLAVKETHAFLLKMQKLGFDKKNTIKLIEKEEDLK